ncbi:hypothetical protein AB0H92_27185 [Streptomyces phaeochromogenes]
MTSAPNEVAEAGQESVVIASFDDHRHAEHMVASLASPGRSGSWD